MGRADNLAAEIASGQRGLLTREQALAAGVSAHQIRNRIETGAWSRLHRNVYRLAGAARTWEQRVLGAVLAVPGAVASHLTGAALWAFPDVGPDAPVEITVPRLAHGRVRRTLVHRPEDLAAPDRTEVAGIPVTSVPRTLVDLSARLSAGQLGRALDDALRRRLTSLWAVEQCVDRLDPGPGRRTSVIRMLLAERGDGSAVGESGLEWRVHRAILTAGLPPPTPQHEVVVGGHRYRLDLAYPEVRLAIEVDGWVVHHTRTAFDGDRHRANALVAAGWTILRFTARSSDDEVAGSVGGTLVRLGRRRGA
ncbi:MAG: type IV toxin-antitoxin system AbiEi family antitoxin domain-containing protein [Acidimicrobiia bacterium]|nr:type IV toxin-antitoxin system AbiEi family antitoxin domain-containing protein [Acidimicrobiia bacterium]